METVFITGANRGIGRELVRQCTERGDRVIATARRSDAVAELRSTYGDHIIALPCDVADDESIQSVRRSLEGVVPSIDILVNSAGRYSLHSDHWDAAATGFASLSRRELATIYDVNAAGPMLVIQALLDLLRRAPRPRILNLSSLLGSVSDRTNGGDYAYAASKAALNIMTRSFAAEFRRDSIIAVAITPGWVRTEMGGRNATLSPADSVRGLLAMADRLRLEDSGCFIDYQGKPQPW